MHGLVVFLIAGLLLAGSLILAAWAWDKPRPRRLAWGLTYSIIAALVLYLSFLEHP